MAERAIDGIVVFRKEPEEDDIALSWTDMAGVR